MTRHTFALQPYHLPQQATVSNSLQLNISGELSRQDGDLLISYQVTGPGFSAICWPKLSHAPSHKDELWRHTCFELFVAQPGLNSYHEYNFSPSGDWAVYSFSDYREISEHKNTLQANISSDILKDKAMVQVHTGLAPDCRNSQLAVGITAVIETNMGSMHYYALTHTGDKPDFHRSDSFILKL